MIPGLFSFPVRSDLATVAASASSGPNLTVLFGPLPAGYKRVGGVPPVTPSPQDVTSYWSSPISFSNTLTSAIVHGSGYTYRWAATTATLYYSYKGAAFATTTAPVALPSTSSYLYSVGGAEVLSDGRFCFAVGGIFYIFTPGVGWSSLTVTALAGNPGRIVPFGSGKCLIDSDTAAQAAYFDGTAIQAVTGRTGTWTLSSVFGPYLGNDGLWYFFNWTTKTATPVLAWATFNMATGAFSSWTSATKSDGALSAGTFTSNIPSSSTFAVDAFIHLPDGRWCCMYDCAGGGGTAAVPLVLNTTGPTLLSPLGNSTTYAVFNTIYLDPNGLINSIHGYDGTAYRWAYSFDLVNNRVVASGLSPVTGVSSAGFLQNSFTSDGLGLSLTTTNYAWWNPLTGWGPNTAFPTALDTLRFASAIGGGMLAVFGYTNMLLAAPEGIYYPPVPFSNYFPINSQWVNGGYGATSPRSGGLAVCGQTPITSNPVISQYCSDMSKLVNLISYYAQVTA